MGSVLYSPLAREDLLDIWVWIARDNPAAADRVWERLTQHAQRLATYPELGMARPDIGDDARSLTVERWLILYRVHADAVEIVRVMDAARDIRQMEWAETRH